MTPTQVQTPVDTASAIPATSAPAAQAERPKAALKDSWWVLVLVPVVAALVPLVNTLLETKRPERHDIVQTNNFAGPMFFGNVSLVEQQYEQKTGHPLNDPDLKKKIEEARTFTASNNFAAAALLLSSVAEKAPVAAVFNNLGVAYANRENGLGSAEDAFRKAVDADPNYKAAWVNLGLVQERQGKLEDALASFLKAPDLAANDIKVIGEKLSPAPGTPAPSAAPLAAARVNNSVVDGHNILDAKTIALESAQRDTITAGAQNYFGFVTPPKYRDRITIFITNRSTTLEPWLKLFNAAKSDISGDQYNVTAGANLEFSFASAPNSKYYVAVGSTGNTPGEYTLLVKPAHAYDRYEPNDDILHAAPVDLGKAIAANIMDANDVDYYQFKSPSRPGKIEISIANRSTTLAPWLKVFNAAKSDISGDQYNGTHGADLKYTLEVEPNSTYYVAVANSGGTAGDYTLTIQPR